METKIFNKNKFIAFVRFKISSIPNIEWKKSHFSLLLDYPCHCSVYNAVTMNTFTKITR